jgi:hypothetical protein
VDGLLSDKQLCCCYNIYYNDHSIIGLVAVIQLIMSDALYTSLIIIRSSLRNYRTEFELLLCIHANNLKFFKFETKDDTETTHYAEETVSPYIVVRLEQMFWMTTSIKLPRISTYTSQHVT